MSLRLLVVTAMVAAACTPSAAEPGTTTDDPSPASRPEPSTTTSSTAAAAPTTSTSTTAPTTEAPDPTVARIATVTAADLGSSWRPGCPVEPADLRAVSVRHRTFDDDAATGTIIVHADVAAAVLEVFERLWELGFPLSQVVPVDRFGSSDDASMAANNTSGFNCRPTTGGSRWSEHAYGRAIDVNPVQNPYVRGSTVLPPAGSAHLDRSRLDPGMVTPDVVAAFAAAGWSWGGDWSSPDYQHFSTSGR